MNISIYNNSVQTVMAILLSIENVNKGNNAFARRLVNEVKVC